MANAVVRYGKDTWAGSGAPSVNHNDANRIKLNGTTVYGYLHAKSPVPAGLTVVSATLTLYVAKASDWTGAKTVTVKRLAERVPFGRLTWDNKPGVTGTAVTAATSSPAAGTAVNFDVTAHLQTVANGDPHYGWRLSTDSTTAHRFYGYESDYPPVLTVEYAISPSQPVDLSPSGGAVSVAKPVVSFDAVDLSQPGDMSALQVQIDAAGDFTTGIDFDSGEVATTVPELDLATTAYAGLADGATTYWRARYKSGEGVWGAWSDAVSFSRTAKGTLTITNPAASPNNFVAEATPPLTHTFSGTQVAWRKFVTLASDHTEIVADSKKQDGTDLSWTPPAKKLQDDGAYTLFVRVWDGVDRVATPGDPLYTQATRDFTFQYDATVTAPTMVSATQQGVTPFVEVTFTRATAPDSWTILRDGKVIDAGIDPVDTFTTGTTHVYTDPGASPQVAHTYEVRAVVNGKASAKSAVGTVTTAPTGIWLLDTELDLAVLLLDRDEGSWGSPDDAGTYYPVGASAPVRVVSAIRGLEGSLSGLIADALGHEALTLEADLYRIKKRPTRPVQLVLADVSMPVLVSNLTIAPLPETRGGDVLKRVTFDFVQVGDFPWEA